MFAAVLLLAAAACGKCHVEAGHVQTSRMTKTLGAAPTWERSEVARRVDGWDYRISRGGDAKLWYEVRRGTESVRLPVAWIFGSGRTGQTFVLQGPEGLIESRVSYYSRPGTLDLTIGAANAKPGTLAEAAGRAMSASDVKDCFGCHSSAPSGAKPGHPGTLVEGVGCERCHGDAGAHPGKKLASLRNASAEDISELCGTCHRTWEQVMLMKLKGVNTVRFQPYRLSQSRCYDPADRRIACTSCHDPHRASTSSDVDKACRACHTGSAATAKAGAKTCPKAREKCTSCHMPEYELPGAHAVFADHRIRVAREGEAFPD